MGTRLSVVSHDKSCQIQPNSGGNLETLFRQTVVCGSRVSPLECTEIDPPAPVCIDQQTALFQTQGLMQMIKSHNVNSDPKTILEFSLGVHALVLGTSRSITARPDVGPGHLHLPREGRALPSAASLQQTRTPFNKKSTAISFRAGLRGEKVTDRSSGGCA